MKGLTLGHRLFSFYSLFPIFRVLFFRFGFPFAFIPFLPLGQLDISLPAGLR